MKFDEQGINEIKSIDEKAAIEMIIPGADIEKQISELKDALAGLDISAPWADVAEKFDFIRENFKDLTDIVSMVDQGLKIRAAAIEAKKICNAGFEFDQIVIDGINLHRTRAGICEHGFYDPLDQIPF